MSKQCGLFTFLKTFLLLSEAPCSVLECLHSPATYHSINFPSCIALYILVSHLTTPAHDLAESFSIVNSTVRNLGNCLFIVGQADRRRSQWLSGLRRRSATARLLRSWVWIPPVAWMSCCECCVLSRRGLCDELISRPEESYRLWCVVVWSRNLVNDEVPARQGAVATETEQKQTDSR
jgi:hypothetical protein